MRKFMLLTALIVIVLSSNLLAATAQDNSFYQKFCQRDETAQSWRCENNLFSLIKWDDGNIVGEIYLPKGILGFDHGWGYSTYESIQAEIDASLQYEKDAAKYKQPPYPYVWGWYVPDPQSQLGWDYRTWTLEISDFLHINASIQLPPYYKLNLSISLYGPYTENGATEIIGFHLR